MLCQRGEIGRHRGFKIPRLCGCGGSSPPAGTIFEKGCRKLQPFFCARVLLFSAASVTGYQEGLPFWLLPHSTVTGYSIA